MIFKEFEEAIVNMKKDNEDLSNYEIQVDEDGYEVTGLEVDDVKMIIRIMCTD